MMNKWVIIPADSVQMRLIGDYQCNNIEILYAMSAIQILIQHYAKNALEVHKQSRCHNFLMLLEECNEYKGKEDWGQIKLWKCSG